MAADPATAVWLAAVAADRAAMDGRITSLHEALGDEEWGATEAMCDHVATCIHHWYGGAGWACGAS